MTYKKTLKKKLELAFRLAKANFKLRNEGSFLGSLWYLLNPLAFFFVILLLRGSVFIHGDILNYPLFLLIGLVMYNFFTQTIGDSILLIQGHGSLLKSVQLDSEALVIARVIQAIFSHSFEILLILGLMIYYQLNFWLIIFYLPILLIFLIFILGLSFLLSTLGVFISDLRNIWTIFAQLLFFLTPIFHLPAAGTFIEKVNLWNPLSYFLQFARDVLVLGNLPSLKLIFITLLWSLLSLTIGLFFFRKYKQRFAELI